MSNHSDYLRRLLHAAPADHVLMQRAGLPDNGRPFTPAAVLIGFAPDAQGSLNILMTRRADHLRHHRSQHAFPGGKIEAQDRDAAACALRETQEETAVPPDSWQLIGRLPECRTPSGFAITPVAALAAKQPATRAQADEVAEIFWLPAAAALDPNRYTWRPHPLGGNAPVLAFEGRDIWGATALMLHYLAQCASSLDSTS